jgi:hypothetical protein
MPDVWRQAGRLRQQPPTAVGLGVGLTGTQASRGDAVSRHFARFGGGPSTSVYNVCSTEEIRDFGVSCTSPLRRFLFRRVALKDAFSDKERRHPRTDQESNGYGQSSFSNKTTLFELTTAIKTRTDFSGP